MLLRVLLQPLFVSIASAATITVSTYSSLPSTAAGPPIPTSSGYRVQSFGDGAYMVTDGLYQAMFLEACDSVIAVDAPPTIGENMIRAIRSVTPKPITHVVYSHHHADHIGGAYLYGNTSNLTIVSHQLTAEELALTPDPTRPAPSVTFEKSHTLTVCNQTLHLDYRGPNHDPGNIFIYAPKQKVLMLVDIVYPGWIAFDKLGEGQNIPGYIKAHDQLLEYDFDHYIGGHLDRPGTRRDVLVSREYVHDLFDTASRAINMSAETNNSLSFASVIAPPVEKLDPYNDWALTNTYIDVLADYVTKEIASRWGTRLYGTDVYGRSNAITMLEAVRIDWGILGPFGVINA